MNSSKKRKKQT